MSAPGAASTKDNKKRSAASASLSEEEDNNDENAEPTLVLVDKKDKKAAPKKEKQPAAKKPKKEKSAKSAPSDAEGGGPALVAAGDEDEEKEKEEKEKKERKKAVRFHNSTPADYINLRKYWQNLASLRQSLAKHRAELKSLDNKSEDVDPEDMEAKRIKIQNSIRHYESTIPRLETRRADVMRQLEVAAQYVQVNDGGSMMALLLAPFFEEKENDTSKPADMDATTA